MVPALAIHPTGPGIALAAAAVALGAPLFSDGLRAVRLRRHFSRLREFSLADLPSGFVQVHGQVALESPLFAPLSNVACAGFRLEVRVEGRPLVQRVDEHRRFRLIDGGVHAIVLEQGSRWDLPVSAVRTVASNHPLSANLTTLIERTPEMRWARRAGETLQLTERALAVGSRCHVIGYARHARPAELFAEDEMQRTGTDDRVADSPARHAQTASASDPDLWLGPGEHLDFLLVSHVEPTLARWNVPAWRSLGAAFGPALSMAGLLYLASALDFMRASGRF